MDQRDARGHLQATGSDEYARANRSFGLTTLRNRHVTVIGTGLRFRFRGKGSVTRCGALPGQELFQYVDERGDPRPIESADVNACLRDAAEIEVTANDFRTWIGTLLAFHELRAGSEPGAVGSRQRAVLKRSLERVATTLGHTPAVSRESYSAPAIIDAFQEASLPAGRGVAHPPGQAPLALGRREELALVRFLEQAGSAMTNPARRPIRAKVKDKSASGRSGSGAGRAVPRGSNGS